MLNLYKLHKKPKKLDWYQKYSKLIDDVIGYREFDNVMGVLHIIKQEPGYIHWYAYDVIKGRWIEMEPYIMRDYYCAFYYARDIIKGRWPEVEPHMMKCPSWACQYATYIIGDRWIEAEEYIKKDNDWWKAYCGKFNI